MPDNIINYAISFRSPTFLLIYYVWHCIIVVPNTPVLLRVSRDFIKPYKQNFTKGGATRIFSRGMFVSGIRSASRFCQFSFKANNYYAVLVLGIFHCVFIILIVSTLGKLFPGTPLVFDRLKITSHNIFRYKSFLMVVKCWCILKSYYAFKCYVQCLLFNLIVFFLSVNSYSIVIRRNCEFYKRQRIYIRLNRFQSFTRYFSSSFSRK